MNKDDVKAIFIIFLILLLISTVGLLGLNIYLTIIQTDEDDFNIAYEGNASVLPEKEENTNVLANTNNNI